MRTIFIQLTALALAAQLAAQDTRVVWSAAAPTAQTFQNQNLPKKFKTFQLDLAAMTNALERAPMEFTAAARQQKLQVELPTADGGWQQFTVENSPVMHPDLAKKYPEIQTFSGRAADGSIARLGVGHKGFHAFVFSPEGKVQSIRPAVEGRGDGQYLVYHLDDLERLELGKHVACGNEDAPLDADFFKNLDKKKAQAAGDRGGAAEVVLKKYRLAVSAQSEYSAFHGNTKPLVLSAVVEALNFITPMQERDFAMRLELIPNNDTLFWFDAATDPFFGPLVSSWKDQNPAA